MRHSKRTRLGAPKTGTVRCPPPCGKVRFLSRKQARGAARNFHCESQRVRVYECGQWPGFWHLTTWDAERTTRMRDARARGAA
jgi:hypothetical protein